MHSMIQLTPYMNSLLQQHPALPAQFPVPIFLQAFVLQDLYYDLTEYDARVTSEMQLLIDKNRDLQRQVQLALQCCKEQEEELDFLRNRHINTAQKRNIYVQQETSPKPLAQPAQSVQNNTPPQPSFERVKSPRRLTCNLDSPSQQNIVTQNQSPRLSKSPLIRMASPNARVKCQIANSQYIPQNKYRKAAESPVKVTEPVAPVVRRQSQQKKKYDNQRVRDFKSKKSDVSIPQGKPSKLKDKLFKLYLDDTSEQQQSQFQEMKDVEVDTVVIHPTPLESLEPSPRTSVAAAQSTLATKNNRLSHRKYLETIQSDSGSIYETNSEQRKVRKEQYLLGGVESVNMNSHKANILKEHNQQIMRRLEGKLKY